MYIILYKYKCLGRSPYNRAFENNRPMDEISICRDIIEISKRRLLNTDQTAAAGVGGYNFNSCSLSNGSLDAFNSACVTQEDSNIDYNSTQIMSQVSQVSSR